MKTFNDFPGVFIVSFMLITFISSGRIVHSQSGIKNINSQGGNHQADRWYFGQNAGLDFRSQDPVVDLTNYLLNVPTSPAIMADSLGNILFFTDGIKVFNSQDQIMPNGEGLHGFVSNAMPVLIVPLPGSDSIYYIFTTHRPLQNEWDPGLIYGLEYNEVDMSLNEGLGDVTIKNKVLLEPEVSAKLSAVQHANGIDYWVVAHRFDSDEFCAFLIKADGVDSANYVSSHVGSFHLPPGEDNNAVGYLKLSPDGTKLALAIHGSDRIEIFDFDNSTGKVTNAITSPPVFDEAYGIEFSPDSKYLYATTTSVQLPSPPYVPPSYLFQFYINSGNNIFTQGFYSTIAYDTLGSYFGGMQLGPDGRIYVSRSPLGQASLSVIRNPKRQDQACNFTANALYLQGRESRYGFPNFVQSYFDLPHFDVSNTAYGETSIFTLRNHSNVDELFWQFGDPASGSDTSSEMEPGHVFSAPGTYLVQVTESFNGVEYGTFSHTVEIINFQQIDEIPSGQNLFSVYPNPGNGNFNLVFKQDLKEAVICVRNIFGQQVWGPVKFDDVEVNKEVRIELAGIPEGVFIVQVTGQNADSYVSRFILKR